MLFGGYIESWFPPSISAMLQIQESRAHYKDWKWLTRLCATVTKSVGNRLKNSL